MKKRKPKTLDCFCGAGMVGAIFLTPISKRKMVIKKFLGNLNKLMNFIAALFRAGQAIYYFVVLIAIITNGSATITLFYYTGFSKTVISAFVTLLFLTAAFTYLLIRELSRKKEAQKLNPHIWINDWQVELTLSPKSGKVSAYIVIDINNFT